MSTRNWTAKVFVNSDVGTIDAYVSSSTRYGAEQQIRAKYGDYEQMYNLREVSGNGGGSASEPGGCGGVVLLIIGAIIIGAFAGGEKDGRPSTPPESFSQPQSRIIPQTYANPPGPCVTANFEPC